MLTKNVLSYQECEKLYSQKKGSGDYKLTHNTWLVKEIDGSYAVRLHNTDVVVVTIHRDGTYTLDSGGFQTVTTKNRINTYSPANVVQRGGEWLLEVGGLSEGPFKDGMKVDSQGIPIELEKAEKEWIEPEKAWEVGANALSLTARAGRLIHTAACFVKALEAPKKRELYALLEDLKTKEGSISLLSGLSIPVFPKNPVNWLEHPVCDWLEEHGGSKWFVVVLNAY